MLSKKPVEKIQVNELCRLAQINKSTFYRHYLDIYDLFSSLESELFEKIVADFEFSDMLFSNPEKFLQGLIFTLTPYREQILLLFDGRIQNFAERTEKWLSSIYLNKNSTQKEKITFSFIVGGAVHAFLCPDFHLNDVTDTIVSIMNKLGDSK